MTALGPLPEPEILIKKVKAKGHGGHHGGAWKVAYADFVTAMMAFFLLMWLLGATNEEERKGIADYFAPSILQANRSGGSGGVLGGRSIEQPDGMAPHPQRSGITPATPFQQVRDTEEQRRKQDDDQQLQKLEAAIRDRMNRDPALKGLHEQIRFTHTPEGLRIELIDKADYSMFATGTAAMDPRARALLAIVAQTISGLTNKLAIRGHTDSAPFRREGQASNNWALSAERAEATRQGLMLAGVPASRFSRLEGVADTDPYLPADPLDPRNRRMSVTLLRQ